MEATFFTKANMRTEDLIIPPLILEKKSARYYSQAMNNKCTVYVMITDTDWINITISAHDNELHDIEVFIDEQDQQDYVLRNGVEITREQFLLAYMQYLNLV
jgi:hypothetical protein